MTTIDSRSTDAEIDAEILRVTREIDRLTGAGLEHKGWRIFPGGTLPRDDTPLQRSNHRLILRSLIAAAGGNPDDDWGCVHHIGRDDAFAHYDATGVYFGIASFGHFAHGHIAEIVYDATDDICRHLAYDTYRRLDRYPILDECDYSAEEWADNHPEGFDEDMCYSDDPDCPCDRPRRRSNNWETPDDD